jgi:hypothetical protein
MTRPRSRMGLSIVNLLGFIAAIVVNALSTTIPLGGRTPGQLSDQYPNLFVPAGLTFSIWGLIYVLLAIFVVYCFVFSARRSAQDDSFMEKVGVLFFITCLANLGWIFAWQYQILPLSLVLMAVLLCTLIMIYVRLNVGNAPASAAEKYLVHLPMSIYLGWISIATIANVTAVLVAWKWTRFGLSEQFWAVIMIVAGIVLAGLMLFRRNDIFYALVVGWALVGILLKRIADMATPAGAVVLTTIAGISLICLGVLVQIARRRVYRR